MADQEKTPAEQAEDLRQGGYLFGTLLTVAALVVLLIFQGLPLTVIGPAALLAAGLSMMFDNRRQPDLVYHVTNVRYTPEEKEKPSE